jgi:hypothetical protein
MGLGSGQNSLEISVPLHLLKICQVRPLSISMDSNFKREMFNFSTSAPHGERSFFAVSTKESLFFSPFLA